jgi:hypothetical protein
MSILSGFKKQKKYITDDNGDHQLISDWTHTDTVMTESGENLTEYLQTHSGVDTKVTQTETTTNADYELLLSGTADSTTRTEGANKSGYAKFNPSKKAFVFGKRPYDVQNVGTYSVVEGFESSAEGSSSHAEGSGTVASGDYSHSEGYGTIAQCAYQHVFGKHNIADTTGIDGSYKGDYIEIVGNGTSNARSNARTLDWDGNETLAGTLTVGVEPTGYMDVATKRYVDSRTTPDISVTQTETGNDVVGDYEILFSESTGNTTLTEGARKTERFYYNPYYHALTFGTRLANSGIGYGSIALGYDVEASSDGSYAEGEHASSTGYYSHAENSGTATGHHSHAEGLGTSSGEYSHAEGSGSEASGQYSHAEGLGTTASARKSHAEGQDTEASGEASHAEGLASEASGDGSHAEGDNTIASGYHAHAEGSGTQATSYQAHAEGYSTTASGASSHSEGDGTFAQGDYSHAEGVGTEATVSAAHAEGQDTQATGYYAHSEGNTTLASGWGSHAEGYQTQATGYYAHAEGDNTIASDYASHAEGSGNVASAYQAHAEGYGTTASGEASHSEGNSTEANGASSHAEGQVTTADGIGSHAEGSGTQATGYFAHSEGDSTVASGDCSHTEGFNTEASGSYQHVEGRYNEIDQNGAYIHIAGNGYVDDQDVVRRSNAYTLDWDGNGSYAHSVYLGNANSDIYLNNGTWDGTHTSLKDTITAILARL